MKRCYMILFESNLVKVGYANPLYYRIKEHKRNAEIHGNKVKRIWFSDAISDYEFCESKMIIECSKSFDRVMNEYFVGAKESMCEFILKSTGVSFHCCDDIVASQKQDCFHAVISDNRFENENENENFDEFKPKSKAETMSHVLKVIQRNKFLSHGVIKNRSRAFGAPEVEMAISDLLEMGKIELKEEKHKKTGKIYRLYFAS